MDIATLIGLMIQFGPKAFDLAEALIARIGSGEAVTPEFIAHLRDLAANTPTSKMIAALTNAGIPLDSDKGKAFLSLVP